MPESLHTQNRVPNRVKDATNETSQEERIAVGDKILVIPEKVRQEMRTLDEFVAANETVAEICGWGLTRQGANGEEVVEEFVAPDPKKVFNLKSLFLTHEQSRLMDLLSDSRSLTMKGSGSELVIIPDETEDQARWLKIPQGTDGKLQWGNTKQNLDVLAGFELPEELAQLEARIRDVGLSLQADWELILSGASVIFTHNFTERIRQRAEATGTHANFTMHHHPSLGILKGRLKDMNVAERREYYSNLLQFSVADLRAMQEQGVDIFEIRALGTENDPDSNQTTNRFFSMSNILKKSEVFEQTLKKIVGDVSDTSESVEGLVRSMGRSIQDLEAMKYSSAAIMEFYLGEDTVKEMRAQLKGDFDTTDNKKFLLYHLLGMNKRPFPNITSELLRARDETQIASLHKKVRSLYRQGGDVKQKIDNLSRFFPDLFAIDISTDEPHIREVAEAINHFLPAELAEAEESK